MAIRSLTLSSLLLSTIFLKRQHTLSNYNACCQCIINYNSPNLTVSLAIITSSFVGITITLTGECG